MDTDQGLPKYDPLSHVAKRERFRLRSAQKSVHLIPLLVLVCAIILWFFSASTASPHHWQTQSSNKASMPTKITEFGDGWSNSGYG